MTDLLSTPAAGPASVRGGGLRGVGFLLGSLASAASAALLFRHLGVDDTGKYVAIVSLVTHAPRPPAFYKTRLAGLPLSHITVEVAACEGADA